MEKHNKELERANQLMNDINKTIAYSKELSRTIILIQIEIEEIKTLILSAKLIKLTAPYQPSTSSNIGLPDTMSNAVAAVKDNINRLKSFTQEYMETFEMFMRLIDLVTNTFQVYFRKLVAITAHWDHCEYQQHANCIYRFLNTSFENPLRTNEEERTIRLSNQGEVNKTVEKIMKSVIQKAQHTKVTVEEKKGEPSSGNDESVGSTVFEVESSENNEIIEESIADEIQEVRNTEAIMPDTTETPREETRSHDIDLQIQGDEKTEEGDVKQKEDSKVENKDKEVDQVEEKTKEEYACADLVEKSKGEIIEAKVKELLAKKIKEEESIGTVKVTKNENEELKKDVVKYEQKDKIKTKSGENIEQAIEKPEYSKAQKGQKEIVPDTTETPREEASFHDIDLKRQGEETTKPHDINQSKTSKVEYNKKKTESGKSTEQAVEKPEYGKVQKEKKEIMSDIAETPREEAPFHEIDLKTQDEEKTEQRDIKQKEKSPKLKKDVVKYDEKDKKKTESGKSPEQAIEKQEYSKSQKENKGFKAEAIPGKVELEKQKPTSYTAGKGATGGKLEAAGSSFIGMVECTEEEVMAELEKMKSESEGELNISGITSEVKNENTNSASNITQRPRGGRANNKPRRKQ